MAGEEYVVTSVRGEKWKLEAAKRAGINISEVVRRALDLALAAHSKDVTTRDVLRNEEVIAAMREEFQREMEEEERELEERRKRAEEVAAKMKEEEERRKKRSEKVQAERLKAWLRRRPAVVAEMMEYLRKGISEEEIYAWLMYEMRAPFVFVRVFKEVLHSLLEEYARQRAESSSSASSKEASSSASEAGREEAEEEARTLIKQARSILEGY